MIGTDMKDLLAGNPTQSITTFINFSFFQPSWKFSIYELNLFTFVSVYKLSHDQLGSSKFSVDNCPRTIKGRPGVPYAAGTF